MGTMSSKQIAKYVLAAVVVSGVAWVLYVGITKFQKRNRITVLLTASYQGRDSDPLGRPYNETKKRTIEIFDKAELTRLLSGARDNVSEKYRSRIVDFREIQRLKDEISIDFVWVNLHFRRSNYLEIDENYWINVRVFGARTSVTKSSNVEGYVSLQATPYTVDAMINYFSDFDVFEMTGFDISDEAVSKFSPFIFTTSAPEDFLQQTGQNP